ncbi:unnamed protein product, partial [Timema podura]|nr:unnamed protein product [Timema podura]
MKPTTRNVSCVVWIAVVLIQLCHSHILIDRLALNLFTQEFYEVLRKTVPDSFVVSPLSARLGAALIAVGARGNTAEELTSALHLPNDPGVIKKTVIRFLAAPKTNNESEVLFANALFPSDEYPLKQRYVADAHTYFRAHVQTVDYQQSEEVMETINRWAAEKTHNLIRNMVEPRK